MAVVAHDLVQSVHLPAGEWKVTFHYVTPGLQVGLLLSGVAALALVVVVLVLLVLGRRRQADRVQP